MRRTKLFVSVLLLLAILANVGGTARAAITVPPGFTKILSDTGVKVYRKTYSLGEPDYVTVVDLRSGTLRNFTGWVDGTAVYRKTLRTFWNDAVAQNSSLKRAKVVLNGTFFATNDTNPSPPVGIAFGLKADWWLMSYGYGVNNEYPGLIRTLAFDSDFGSSSIQSYSRGTFDSGIPNVVGGLDATANKSPNSYIARTFVGVRDDNNDGHSETVMFFSSKKATQSLAFNTLRSFGAGSIMMLDGGGSGGLIVDGTSHITPSRSIPQAFVVYAGR
jgi:hypothetical protein